MYTSVRGRSHYPQAEASSADSIAGGKRSRLNEKDAGSQARDATSRVLTLSQMQASTLKHISSMLQGVACTGGEAILADH